MRCILALPIHFQSYVAWSNFLVSTLLSLFYYELNMDCCSAKIIFWIVTGLTWIHGLHTHRWVWADCEAKTILSPKNGNLHEQTSARTKTVTQSVGTELPHCMCLAGSSNQGLGQFQFRSLMEIYLPIYLRPANGPRPDLQHLFLSKGFFPGNTLNARFHRR